MRTPLSCLKCKLDHLVVDPIRGEMLCSLCGLVVQEKMQETRILFHDNGVNRRGTEPYSLAYYDMGLSTIIGMTIRDAKGQKIQPSIQCTIRRLRNLDRRIELHSSKDRNLKHAFSLLYTLKDKFSLSNATIEKVAYIYRKALLKRVIRGRSIESVLAAATYIAIGYTLSPITLKEISEVSNIKLKIIARMVRLLALELDILISVADPIRCVIKIGNIAGLSEKTKRKAVHLMSHIRVSGYSNGKKPM